jgi:hypothetical protein
MNTWLFHADPRFYNIEEKVPAHLLSGETEDWHPRVFLSQMQEKDRVILWQSGAKGRGGIYAFGELAGKPYRAAGENRVDIRYTELLKQPVFKGELEKHPFLKKLAILKMPNGKNPCRVLDDEWVALNELISKDTLNIFTYYRQEENRFTNGLVSLLELSAYCGTPLVKPFLGTLLDLELPADIKGFRVLRRIDGTADAELCGRDICIRLETKIESGTLREDQISDHLDRLKRSPETLKLFVLLTPDDGNSDYIRQFLSSKTVKLFSRHSERCKVLHLEWRRVYKFLENRATKDNSSAFNQLVLQFLRQIHDRIFDQDFAGIIQKINFPKGEINPLTYLKDMKRWRKGDWWDTPQKYQKLDGTGRKLLLYDGERKEKGIVAEVEIERVEQKRGGGDFSWRNVFASKPKLFEPPILLDRIRLIAGFEDFGKYQKDRNAFRNVTREQYKQLTGEGA